MVADAYAQHFLDEAEYREALVTRVVEQHHLRAARKWAREWQPKVYEDGLPVLTPDTWRRMGRLAQDGDGMGRHAYCTCGRCGLCAFYLDIDRLPSDRYERVQLVDTESPMFWSVEAALDRYVAIRQHGYGSRSVAGTVLTIGEQGAIITGGVSEGTAEQLEAERVAAVELALCEAYDAGNDRGLGAEACVQILLSRVVGDEIVRKGRDGKDYRRQVPTDMQTLTLRWGVTAQTIAGIVQSGMRRLRVELAARGLIPRPNERRGLDKEIARRREELARRRVEA